MQKFDPDNRQRLLSPERRKWQDPDAILDALGLAAGMTLADIGCGPGFFTLPAAAKVGPEGRVYALDIEPKMLDTLRERVATEGVANVEIMTSQEDELPLPDGAVDLALLANVLHECPEPTRLLIEIDRVLRPEGALAIVEWRKELMERGPALSERMAQEEVESALHSAGYHAVEPFEVGPYHYGVRAHKGN